MNQKSVESKPTYNLQLFSVFSIGDEVIYDDSRYVVEHIYFPAMLENYPDNTEVFYSLSKEGIDDYYNVGEIELLGYNDKYLN